MADDITVCMLVWSYWPDHQGGAERQCRKLVGGLAAQGIKCEVVTARLDRRIERVTMDGACRVVRLGLFCPFIARMQLLANSMHHFCPSDVTCRAAEFWLMLPVMWLARLSFILAAKRYFSRKGEGIDLIHVHESGWLAGVGVWLGRYCGIPVMAKEALFPSLMPIGYDAPFRRTWDDLRRRAYFVAMASYIREDLKKRGIKDEKIIMLPNGVPVHGEQADVRLNRGVLFVGNFSQGMMHKAFDVLIDAWAIVHCQINDARLTLAGSGDSDRWKRKAASEGCLESITFTGWVSDTDSLFRRSGIFVLPSRMEGLSNSLLEAQSWGIACVVSDIPGNLALVEHDVNGFVVPVGNARALADALLKLLRDPGLRVRLGREARRKMISEYEIGVVSKRFAATYRQLIDAKSGGSLSS